VPVTVALSNDLTIAINKICGRAGLVEKSRGKTQVFPGGNVMKCLVALIAAIAGATLASDCASAQAAKSGVERLYIIDCGTSVGPDKSRWTPGVDVGKPLPMVGNCYLIRHAQG
jgi:hypothetical protein